MSKKIIVEISARHVHISDEHLAILFGEGAVLHKKKDLSQPGQYACEERVDIVGPKRTQKNVSILGPTRPQTQVEISLTDARSLGFASVPIRESGDLAGSPGCTLIGPAGEITIEEGVIVAKRHIHTTPEDAEALGVKDKEIVGLRVNTPSRSAILGDVVVRVRSDFATYVHIDTDEANAIGAQGETECEIVKNV